MKTSLIKIALVIHSSYLVDGSYVFIDNHETIYGESYLIVDEHIQLICHEDETKCIDEIEL